MALSNEWFRLAAVRAGSRAGGLARLGGLALVAGAALAGAGCRRGTVDCPLQPTLGELPVVMRQGEVDTNEWLYCFCPPPSAGATISCLPFGVGRVLEVHTLDPASSNGGVASSDETGNFWTFTQAEVGEMMAVCAALAPDTAGDSAR